MTEITKLNMTTFFGTPVFRTEKPEWLKHLNKVSDNYINFSKKLNNKKIKIREKGYRKKIGDHGISYHSTTMINDQNISEFQRYVGGMSHDILDQMGYDMNQYEMYFTEMWVQEFAKKGGGHHNTHTHYDNHISGFYFLKCSERTSLPVIHDPRPGAVMTTLLTKEGNNDVLSKTTVDINVKPGTMLFFPSYLGHEFIVDHGIDPFRFIHFNLQAIRKDITDTIRKENEIQ
jgi:uncharacterized protein (TIGR02466 family)